MTVPAYNLLLWIHFVVEVVQGSVMVDVQGHLTEANNQ